ncbi:hypothetical protein [Bradyrhizobium sp. AUGA SZCCT0431]|uniref:hypothetical protein n=1 Tax=Bradyrhizobium sp. AUGA SZCCT0431 TaxID=2807674 RepID=UPI001BA8DD87|nr:hypothetical protein [Bradyrhizobium sp. AUGA SZCCT0431]MBR1147089.1 hypothetical protein [Bradyrhizobium sp. AUGA SZCCT0431]
MRSSHAAAGKRRGGWKAKAKGDTKNGKLFHIETPRWRRPVLRNSLIDVREADLGSQSADATKFNFRKAQRWLGNPPVNELIEATTAFLADKARAELSGGRVAAGGVCSMRFPFPGHKSRAGAVSLTENVHVA